MERNLRVAEQTAGERFAAAVTEHGHAMFRAARSLLRSDTDAEEAVGEAILRAWQSFGSLRRKEAIRAWLLKITVNCAYEQLRRGGRMVCMEEAPETGAAVGPEETGSLWEAVCRLPRDHRIVVTLFYYEDLTIGQIAKLLGVAQGTVKSRLSRARKDLRELLQEEEEL